MSQTRFEIPLIVACGIYYAVRWYYEFVIKKMKKGRSFYYGFLLILALTTVHQALYIVLTPTPTAVYVIYVFGLLSTVLDMVFDDFPGTGVTCIWLSQLLFCIRIIMIKHVPTVLDWTFIVVGALLWLSSTVFFGASWIFYKHGVRLYHDKEHHPLSSDNGVMEAM